MICASCGKLSKMPICDTCYVKMSELFSIKNFLFNRCRLCGGIEDLKEKIKKHIKTDNLISEINLNKKEVGNRLLISVTCKGKIGRSLEKKETKNVIVILTNKLCDNCIKIRGNYYEAVFQSRGKYSDIIAKKVCKALDNKITSVEKIKEGYNIRITDKKAASSFINFLSKHYTIKRSFKLVGKKKGKELYRSYYAIR